MLTKNIKFSLETLTSCAEKKNLGPIIFEAKSFFDLRTILKPRVIFAFRFQSY